MDPRIRKRLERDLEAFNKVITYVNKEILRKDLILTYVTLIVTGLGMFYQCIDVLSSYLEYPTIMNVLEEREAAKFPAVTMCLSPWYNLTMVCEKNKGQCTKKDVVRVYILNVTFDELFMDCFEELLNQRRYDENHLQMLKLSYPKHGFYRDWREFGLSDPSVLFSCNMTSFLPECPSFDCRKVLQHIYYKVPMMACYTLDLERFMPRNHSYFKCPHTWSYELQIEARWNLNSTMSTMDMQYYPIFFHESDVYAPEPMFSAAMRKDVFLYYTITQQDWSRLKEPYHTDCWDYRDRFGRKMTSVYQGWMNQLSCEQSCRMAQEQQRCNCIRTVNEFSHFMENDLCDPVADDKCNMIMTANNSYFYNKCAGVCNSECSTTRYDVRLSGVQNYYAKNHKKKKTDDLLCGFSVAFSTATVEVYDLIPAMNGEMLMGIMAGFIGVWVGLAFSDMADYAVLLIPSRKEKAPKAPTETLPPSYRHTLYSSHY